MPSDSPADASVESGPLLQASLKSLKFGNLNMYKGLQSFSTFFLVLPGDNP